MQSLVQLMKIYLQGVRVWLNVDNTEDIKKLKELVNDCVVFSFFYTEGYFTSVNCRREIYTAIAAKESIVKIYVNDSTSIADMIREWYVCCTEDRGSDIILENMLTNEPRLWLGNSSKLFLLASIK